MSIGEDRVRVSFNPGGNDLVNIIKAQSASLIDKCEVMRDSPSPSEKSRLIALAQTAFEEGAMWAVKAATVVVGFFALGWLAWTFPAFAADLRLKAPPLAPVYLDPWSGAYI